MKRLLSAVAIILVLGLTYLVVRDENREPVSNTINTVSESTTETNDVSTTESPTVFTAPCGYTTNIGQGPYYVSGTLGRAGLLSV